MNRATRDYCSKGRHIRWRAVTACLHDGRTDWVCTYCRKLLQQEERQAYGSPLPGRLMRLSILRGKQVTENELNRAELRMYQYANDIRDLRARIRWRSIIEGRETQPDYGLFRPKGLKKTTTGWILPPRPKFSVLNY